MSPKAERLVMLWKGGEPLQGKAYRKDGDPCGCALEGMGTLAPAFVSCFLAPVI